MSIHSNKAIDSKLLEPLTEREVEVVGNAGLFSVCFESRYTCGGDYKFMVLLGIDDKSIVRQFKTHTDKWDYPIIIDCVDDIIEALTYEYTHLDAFQAVKEAEATSEFYYSVANNPVTAMQIACKKYALRILALIDET